MKNRQFYNCIFKPQKMFFQNLKIRILKILKIYNILGKEVKTLVNEEKPAGTYTINFNASSISSGVYFYKIQTGKYSDTKKMILTK